MLRDEFRQDLVNTLDKVPTIASGWVYHGRAWDSEVIEMLDKRLPGVVSGNEDLYTVQGILPSPLSISAST